MSYLNDVRHELTVKIPHAMHCRLAYLAGIIFAGGKPGDGEVVVRFQDETLSKIFEKLVYLIFDIDEEKISTVKGKLILPDNDGMVEKKLKLIRKDSSYMIDRMLVQSTCCKSSFLKGCFIAAGSVTDPSKSYHLEVSFSDMERAEFLKEILGDFNVSAKITKRRDSHIVYLKDSDSIVDVLGIMGASNGLMEFENVRILKEIRNSVNREVNCDTANMNKVANAAAKDIEDIELIDREYGISKLPDSLRKLAELRTMYPYLSIKELGDMFNPPLGKSGVNHRIRRIRKMADKLREGM